MTIGACPICGGAREWRFRTQILHKHDVSYYQCGHCGLLQTEEPYWLDEAYSSAIADSDTGIMRRNIALATTLTCLLGRTFSRDARYLDLAGGYGILTRLMRDQGFAFSWQDKYCANIFAKEYELTPADRHFDAITAFEVLEHLYDPLAFLQGALKDWAPTMLILSTELFEGPAPRPEDWWYYATESGQHISFFQLRTMHVLAAKLGLSYQGVGHIHLLTSRRIPRLLLKLATGRLAPLCATVTRWRQGAQAGQEHARAEERGGDS